MKGHEASDKLKEMHKRLQLKLRILPTRFKIALGLSLILSVLSYGFIIHYFLFYNHVANFKFLETHKCPACYGHFLCKDMRDEGIAKLEGFSRLQFLNSLANVKNVNFGTHGGKKVVFKKLGHNSELDNFDMELCEKAKMGSSCKLGDAINRLIKPSRLLTADEVKGVSDLTTCPTRRLLDRMVDRYQEKADAIDMSYPEKLMMITTLMVNPEPITIQTFPKSEGFPFPEYIGACGRFVLIENVGKTLEEYYSAPWEERLDYATQLFRIAELFTENSSQFALYWTDLSYENFAINKDGKVVVIDDDFTRGLHGPLRRDDITRGLHGPLKRDAENIVVVDRWQIKREKASGWDEPFYSEFDNCKQYGNCLSIHPDMLCSRDVTDFNYYALCRNLLSSYASDFMKPDGFLHGTPSDINNKYGLDDMLRECAKPSVQDGRLKIKDKLMKTMEEIRKNVL